MSRRNDSRIENFLFEGLLGMLFAVWKDHVAWFLPFPPPILPLQAEIILQDVVAVRKSQLLCGAINRRSRAFQFHEGPDGRFIELNQETLGPGFRSGHSKGGAVFFIAKPAAHA